MDNTNVIEGSVIPASNMNLASVLRIPAVRQVMLLIGVAVAVAAGFAIALWSQAPGYAPLYSNMDTSEAGDVADALRAMDIDFKVDESTGNILVPEASLRNARMQLSQQGLPQSASAGMEMMQDQSSFGVSQFMESARYQHALESELSRTIVSLGAVREARVHLALPKQSSFIRDQQSASASVLLHIHRGRILEQDQAAAVVNLVAASVPNLTPQNVTVIDQYGSLLSSAGEQSAGAQASTQFKYARRLEETYKARIEDLLTPLVGAGRVRAEVVADIDFTYTEETRESFDPQRAVVRSEHLEEGRQSGNGYVSGGIAGAVSNQPAEATGADPQQTVTAEDSEVQNSSSRSTRNYEVDRTISHTRPQSGTIRKLSVAVLIDEGSASSGAGDEAAESALTDEVLARYTALVREAVGFNEVRGDTVVVLSEAFLRPEEFAEPEPPAIWENPLLRDVLKQVLGALLVIAIAFGIVRPMLRGVVASNATDPISGEYLGNAQDFPMPAGGAQHGGALAPPSYEEKVAAAKNISGHDPARVAQVVKKWVAADV